MQGRVRGNWESCVQAGDQRPTGGYLLRRDSAPTVESVFSESDVLPVKCLPKLRGVLSAFWAGGLAGIDTIQ